MPRRLLRLLALIAVLSVAPGVRAEVAYAMRDLNVRAGPGRDYPLVTWVREGELLDVYGCLESHRWCEVAWGVHRGWVYAGFRAPADIGAPIVPAAALASAGRRRRVGRELRECEECE